MTRTPADQPRTNAPESLGGDTVHAIRTRLGSVTP
jgi:hypothetical protein